MSRLAFWILLLALGVTAVLGYRQLPTADQTFSAIKVQPQTVYGYPTPAYWPSSPFSYMATPMADIGQSAPTILPCPRGMMAYKAQWHGQTVAACEFPGGVPADPGTGPMCAGANGASPYPPVKEPDGSYGC